MGRSAILADRRLRASLRPAVLLMAAAAILSPARHTPLRFDDTLAFEQRTGGFAAAGRDFASHLESVIEIAASHPRIQPLGIALTPIPWLFSGERLAYKLFLLVLTLATLGLLHGLLRRLGLRAGPALLVVALAAAFMQFRRYHDPLLGYSGLMQFSALALIGSLLAWLRFERGGGRRWAVIAVGAWVACLTLYDANLALTPVPLAVAAARHGFGRGALPAAAAFGVPAVLLGLAGFVARSSAPPIGVGYDASYAPAGILETYGTILLGALPASYGIFDPHDVMHGFTAAEALGGLWRGVAVAALTAWVAHRAPQEGAGRDARMLALPGAALWLSSGALLALAPKYQAELVPGVAYLPVFLQVLGVAMVTAALVVVTGGAARRLGAVARMAAIGALAVLAGAAAGATGTANLRVVAWEWPATRTRDLLDASLRAGVLDPLPERATVMTSGRDLNWYPTGFRYDKKTFDGVAEHRTGRRYDMRLDLALTATPCRTRPGRWPRPVCARPSQDGGWLAIQPVRGGDAAVLSRVDGASVTDPAATAAGFRAYTRGALSGTPPELVGVSGTDAPWTSAGSVEWTRIGERRGGTLYDGRIAAGAAQPRAGTVAVAGARVDFMQGAPIGDWVRILGTRPLLP